MEIVQFVADSLGDASYLVVGDGAAAVVDPQRDVRPFVKAARERGVEIGYVFETHVHNDYVSGGRELAALGAKVVAAAKSGLEFPHTPVGDGDSVAFGGVALRAVAAPGHTFDHTAYLGLDERGQARGAFTGGALLMGSAGRSDLLGPENTAELTRLQWETSRKIATLIPAAASVFPTHGAGSFCSTTGAALERSGPLSVEMGRNPALTAETAEAFAAIQLASPAPIPGYYRYISPINRAGPKVYGEPPRPGSLAAEGLTVPEGVTLVDVRPRVDYAAGHVPGSMEIEESGSMLAFVGWLVPFNAPVALIARDEAQAERVTVDLFRIGYEQVRGYLRWSDWASAARPVEQLRTVTLDEARAMRRSGTPVIDTRFEREHRENPLSGAVELPVDRLPDWVGSAPEDALVVCASGQRATMAASVLAAAGKRPTALVEGGAQDL